MTQQFLFLSVVLFTSFFPSLPSCLPSLLLSFYYSEKYKPLRLQDHPTL